MLRSCKLCAIAFGFVWFVACDTEQIKDDRIGQVLSSCCEAARARVELANDIETQKYRSRCNACRLGAGKAQCQAAAQRVVEAVSKAYASEILPPACSTIRAQLGDLGISVP